MGLLERRPSLFLCGLTPCLEDGFSLGDNCQIVLREKV